MSIKSFFLAIALTIAFVAPVSAKGSLVGRTKPLPELELGQGNAGYGISEPLYELETGVGYRLEISTTGSKPCEFTAEEFFQNIWVRKLEVDHIDINVSRINAIEFDDREGEVELLFTPIKPGEYTWECEGLAHKGMTGKIVVK